MPHSPTCRTLLIVVHRHGNREGVSYCGDCGNGDYIVIVVTVCVDSCDVQGMMKVVIVMMMSVRFVKQTMPPAAT